MFYFHKPQPVDVENIMEFPTAYRGVWGQEMDTTIIGKDYVLIITRMESRVERNAVDESNQYRFVDDLVFKLSNEEGDEVSTGSRYFWDQDTLVIFERDVMEIDLGKRAFLREAAEGYIFNRKSENNWWEVYYMGPTKNGDIVIRMLKKEDLKALPEIKKVHEKDGSYYLKVNWTKNEIQEVLGRGGFSDTLAILEQQYRIE
jgi:hypothetical protein